MNTEPPTQDGQVFVKCPKCGTPNLPKNAKCDKCGAQIHYSPLVMIYLALIAPIAVIGGIAGLLDKSTDGGAKLGCLSFIALGGYGCYVFIQRWLIKRNK